MRGSTEKVRMMKINIKEERMIKGSRVEVEMKGLQIWLFRNERAISRKYVHTERG